MRPLALIVGVLCAAVAAGCGGAEHAGVPSDPPTIKPWASIGAATLGMTRGEVEKTFGHPLRTERIRDYFPVGTKYQGKILERSDYRVRQGLLRVAYVDGRAKVLETTSPRYRTAEESGSVFTCVGQAATGSLTPCACAGSTTTTALAC